MICEKSNAAQHRFVMHVCLTTGCCLLLALLAALAFRFGHPKGILAYLTAILPGLPILGMLTATGTYLREEKDEFQRLMLVECLLYGIGTTLAVTTVWGDLEKYALAPRFDLLWVYPLFWLCVGAAVPLVMWRYR